MNQTSTDLDIIDKLSDLYARYIPILDSMGIRRAKVRFKMTNLLFLSLVRLITEQDTQHFNIKTRDTYENDMLRKKQLILFGHQAVKVIIDNSMTERDNGDGTFLSDIKIGVVRENWIERILNRVLRRD